tara:strand:+ start:1659 stop:2234 length:576 start_codon:yes stop_codon:yes gene_type:complete
MAVGHRIEDFKATLTGGGARPNLFEIEMTEGNASIGLPAENTKMLCKAASLPASNIAPIEIPFRGRTFKVAGDRTFDTWTITIINDTNFEIRTAMENWMQKIGQYADASGDTNPADYQIDATVKQLSRLASAAGAVDGTGLESVYEYTFYGIFPTNISAIDLSYDTGDSIEEFTVEFQVQYWEPKPGNNQG